MSFWVAALMVVTGAADVWVEPPMVRVFPSRVRTEGALTEIRLHAARGERESFQICIRDDDEPVDIIDMEASPLDDSIGAPEIRRVGFLKIDQPSPRAIAPETLWPDPLIEFRPCTLEPGETGAFWISYTIPRNASAGTHTGRLTVVFDKKRKQVIDVTIGVFDFTIPEAPTLRAVFRFDRDAIRSAYGLEDNRIRLWRPFYRDLASQRISFSLWDGGDLVRIAPDGTVDTSRFREHLHYAVTTAHMNSIDIGAGASGIAPFPLPKPEERQDPIQFYLHDMGNWLQRFGWLDRAFIDVMPLPDRSNWQDARDAYFRVKRNDKRIARFLEAPVHPYFDRYTDIWAVPLRYYDPYANDYLYNGTSLVLAQEFPARNVSASSSGTLARKGTFDSIPADGYDGSLYSFWISRDAPTQSKPEWFRIDLDEPVATKSLKIIWKAGYESTDIQVRTSPDGYVFRTAKVKWEHFPIVAPYAQSWAYATLDRARLFRSVTFTFSGSHRGGPVGITEILFSDNLPLTPPAVIEPVEPWLSIENDDFPSMATDAHPVEARMAPWVCWGHRVMGFKYGALNRWPETWRPLAAAPPLVWPCPDSGVDFIFYPGADGFLPSIRSELLRDGLEDYEYLAALERLAHEQEIEDAEVIELTKRRYYSPWPLPEELDEWAHALRRARVRIGWALNRFRDGLEKQRAQTVRNEDENP